MFSAYLIHVATMMGIYGILALSLQLAVGFAGLLNLAHVAFFGIGAYTSALLSLSGTGFLTCAMAAAVLSSLAGYFVSFPTRRLKSDYLALATMALTFVIHAIFLNWTELTRGPLGLPGIPRPQIFGFNFYSNESYLVLVLIITLLCFATLRKLTRSPFGITLQAIRDNELAAQSMGKNTFIFKTKALVVSAFFAGLAGSLFAHYITFIDPSSFTLLNLIPILTIVILGGLASLEGTIAATVVLVFLQELPRFIGFPSSIVGPARQMLFSALLILILIYKPKGICGKVSL